MRLIIAFSLFLSFSLYAFDALVWGGPGACEDGCVEGAVTVTKLAGFEPMIVTPENFNPSLFENAKVWVQPGGRAGRASKAMGATLRQQLKEFILKGGGYVGFCAGAFLTTKKIGSTSVTGLGIIEGKTTPYRKSKGSISVQALTTSNGIKYHYWQGGPYFSFTKSQSKKINVQSRYKKTNQINSLQSTYGLGRISIAGTHPEAPQWWFDDSGVVDLDGNDNEEAAQMIKWAAQKAGF